MRPAITPNRPNDPARNMMGNRSSRMVWEAAIVGMLKEAKAVRETTITMAEETSPALTAASPITNAPTMLIA